MLQRMLFGVALATGSVLVASCGVILDASSPPTTTTSTQPASAGAGISGAQPTSPPEVTPPLQPEQSTTTSGPALPPGVRPGEAEYCSALDQLVQSGYRLYSARSTADVGLLTVWAKAVLTQLRAFASIADDPELNVLVNTYAAKVNGLDRFSASTPSELVRFLTPASVAFEHHLRPVLDSGSCPGV